MGVGSSQIEGEEFFATDKNQMNTDKSSGEFYVSFVFI
jgi:hypothetical protein